MTKEENKKLNDDLRYYKEKSEFLNNVIVNLEEENKILKSDLAFERTMLDNVKAEYESSQNVIKNLREELSKYKKQYEHSMGEDDELIYEEGLYD